MKTERRWFLHGISLPEGTESISGRHGLYGLFPRILQGDKVKKLLIVMTVTILMLPFFVGCAAAEDAISSATLSVDTVPEMNENTDTKILVAYFSTDDTVRAAAWTAASALSADVFEIVPAEPYTAADLNYNDSNSRATNEQRDDQVRPALKALPEHMDQYRTILLGYPIWWGQAPRIICSFLENADLSGKTIIPFCTSASSGIGSSDINLHALTDDTVTWLPATRHNRETTEEIQNWALSLGLTKQEEATVLFIRIGDTTLTADLTDNSSAKALTELLGQGDITIHMHDYAGFEKVGELSESLPTNDEDISTEAGDLILYLGKRFVIYYDHNEWDFTRLGKIRDVSGEELKEILGPDDVTVVLSMNP